MSEMVNFKKLFQDLSEVGLVDKPLSQYSKQQIVYLVQSCVNSVILADDDTLKQEESVS